MKVKDLIALLQNKDPEIDVLMLFQENGEHYIQHIGGIDESNYHENEIEIEIIEGTVPCILLHNEESKTYSPWKHRI